jgi:hypothetical protein
MLMDYIRGTRMLQRSAAFGDDEIAPQAGLGGRALRLMALLAMGTMLAACGRCGDFLPSGLAQIGACHSDPPPQQ